MMAEENRSMKMLDMQPLPMEKDTGFGIKTKHKALESRTSDLETQEQRACCGPEERIRSAKASGCAQPSKVLKITMVKKNTLKKSIDFDNNKSLSVKWTTEEKNKSPT